MKEGKEYIPRSQEPKPFMEGAAYRPGEIIHFDQATKEEVVEILNNQDLSQNEREKRVFTYLKNHPQDQLVIEGQIDEVTYDGIENLPLPEKYVLFSHLMRKWDENKSVKMELRKTVETIFKREDISETEQDALISKYVQEQGLSATDTDLLIQKIVTRGTGSLSRKENVALYTALEENWKQQHHPH